ncbi:hypothetical protein CLU79DRAFT_483917 [Phycomyces nitens]|nr:hypothetical protein CLU79DRAFT_483917 [Phycomyces nitens]
MSLVVLKVSLAEQTRRFSLSKDATWRELCDLLEKIFNTPFSTNKSLFYKDNDGECISLSSDLELKHILQQDEKCLRLYESCDPIKKTGSQSTSSSSSSSHGCQEEPRAKDKEYLANISTIPVIKTPQTSFAALFEHFGRLADQYRSVIHDNPYVIRNLGEMASNMLQDINTADINQIEAWLTTIDPTKRYPETPAGPNEDFVSKGRLDEEEDDIELPRTPQEYASDPFYGPLGTSVSSRGSGPLTSLYPSHFSQHSIVSDDETYQTPNETCVASKRQEPLNYTYNQFSKSDEARYTSPNRSPHQAQFRYPLDQPPSAPLKHLLPPPNHHLYPQPPHWSSYNSQDPPEYSAPPYYQQKDHYGPHFYPHQPPPPPQMSPYMCSPPQFDRVPAFHPQVHSLYQSPFLDYSDAKRTLRRAMKEDKNALKDKERLLKDEKKALRDQGKLLKKEVRDIRRSIRHSSKDSEDSGSSYEHEAVFPPSSPNLSSRFKGCYISGGADESASTNKGKGLA